MKKKWVTILLAVLMVSLPAHSLSSELTSLQPNCCCEELCNCDHDAPNEPIIRNIKCGDNGLTKNATNSFRNTLLSTSTTFHPIEYEALFKLLKDKFTTLLICSVDPPPPKPLA